MKRVGPKRVSLLEVGSGINPYGIVSQARRAEKKRIGRKFIGSDTHLNLTQALRAFGLRELPKNAKVLKECSIKTLKAQPNKSLDIVFGSFFLNGVVTESKSKVDSVKSYKEFFGNAKRVLKPNGRLILVMHWIEALNYVEGAKVFGFSSHLLPVSEKMVENSTSEWIQGMSTKNGRERLLKHNENNHDTSFVQKSQNFALNKGLSADEAAKPMIVIMRKLKG